MFTFWLTGFSGAGKTTIATAAKKLNQDIYLLDGDVLREGLCQDLGFSKSDRHENLRRAASVAGILNDAGVIVVASFISPYKSDRHMISNIVGHNRFFEIHVTTEIDVCESRDPKGLYRRAHAGLIPHFTGVSDPYEIPEDPAMHIDTSGKTPSECAQDLIEFIQKCSENTNA